MPSNSFTYAWTFDDGVSGNVASISHTWMTSGNHSATVVATDTTTLTTATATKTIKCADWTQLAWVSTGMKIIPTASANSGNITGLQYTNLITYGNLIINVMDYYTPLNAVVIDTASMTRNEYVNVFSSLDHEPYGAFLLTSGPNAGKVFVMSYTKVNDAHVGPSYGFFDPSTGSFSLSSNRYPGMGVSNDGSSFIRCISCRLSNGNIFVFSTIGLFWNGSSWLGKSDSSDCRIYNQQTDSWTAIASCPLPIAQYAFTLPSGNVFVARSSTYPAYIYNVANNSWSSVPTIPAASTEGQDFLSILSDGRIIVTTNTADSKQATWSEGDLAWTIGAYTIPPGGSTTIAVYQSMLTTNDGMVVSIGGVNNGGNNGFTLFHQPDSTWVQGVALPETGSLYYPRRKSFLNGKVWGSWYTGTLYYLQWA